jgi:hypothetical protein
MLINNNSYLCATKLNLLIKNSKRFIMKKLMYLLVIAIILAACSSEPHYVIKGKIAGSDSIIFYIQKRDAGKYVTIDSAVSKKGSFTIKGGKVAFPQQVMLVAGTTKKRTSFYMENSEITITGTMDSLYKATITGSKTHDEYKAFVDSNKPLSDKYQATYGEYRAASEAKDEAKMAEIEKTLDGIQKEMTDLQKNYVKEHPASQV